MAIKKVPTSPVEPITARVSPEAARRLRVAAALENLSTGQLLDPRQPLAQASKKAPKPTL